MTKKILSWFSCGAASAVATKLVLQDYGNDNVVVINTDVGSEHPDNERFIRDAQEWFGVEVQTIKNPKYKDTWDVWAKRRFLVGPAGALCTTELKKNPRYRVQDEYGPQVYGYTADPRDAQRAVRFRVQNPEVVLLTPLIDQGLTKKDCLGLLERQGIELPAMYKLGYENNNCIGCVKGGMGYWNKIRKDFPEVFERMRKLEQDIGASVIRDKDGPVWLGDLDPARGNYKLEPDIECGIICTSAEENIATEDLL